MNCGTVVRFKSTFYRNNFAVLLKFTGLKVLKDMLFYDLLNINKRHAVVELVEALRYKPKSRGFDSRWCH